MNNNIEPIQFLNTAEAANYLGLKKNTLENWRYFKRGPAYIKIGGLVKYRLADLDAYVDSRTFEKTGY